MLERCGALVFALLLASATQGGCSSKGGIIQGGGTSSKDAGGSGGTGGGGTPCECFFGNGSYCGVRAKALADEVGCSLGLLADNLDNLLSCEDGVWTVQETCNSGACEFDVEQKELTDACQCDCFVKEAWCGVGVQKEANKLGCRVPLLPEHSDDILNCPNGSWAVKEECPSGCIQAPTGTPDSCK